MASGKVPYVACKYGGYNLREGPYTVCGRTNKANFYCASLAYAVIHYLSSSVRRKRSYSKKVSSVVCGCESPSPGALSGVCARACSLPAVFFSFSFFPPLPPCSVQTRNLRFSPRDRLGLRPGWHSTFQQGPLCFWESPALCSVAQFLGERNGSFVCLQGTMPR